MSIADNLRRVEERITRAAESAGRRREEIMLVGVTKYVDVDSAAQLIDAGCRDLGESRPQELWKKHDAFQRAGLLGTRRGEASPPPSASNTPAPPRNPPIRWHLIGHLQRNKVQRTLPLTSLIHSVDSERLLNEINAAVEADTLRPIDVLLEVNTSHEAAKHGLAPDEVEPLLESMSNYPQLFVLGLMTMAALKGGESVAAQNFASLRELRDRLKSNRYPNTALNELSMGMSDDFEIAIKEGATIVRIGSLLWEDNS